MLFFSFAKATDGRGGGWFCFDFSKNDISSFLFHIYKRKIFAHLRDNRIPLWVVFSDFIYIDFLENEVLRCILWAR